MQCSRRIVRTAFVALFFYVSATSVLVFSFINNRVHQYAASDKKNVMQHDSKLEATLSDLISKVDIMAIKIDSALNVQKTENENILGSISTDLVDVNKLVSQMEQQLVEWQIKSFLSHPIINDHNFSYIHNPVDACSKITDLLLVLPSAPTNFEKRQTARSGNRGDYVRNATNNAKMLFFIGRPSHSKNYTQIQQQIETEIETFGDIVQENFEDVYSNNRLKSVSMLKWASTYCPTTKYVIRTDDDINVNVTLLVSVLHRTSQTENNFIIGRKLVNDVPARDPLSKWYLSSREYPPPTLPPYLLGALLGYPISTGKLLYKAALRVKPIWLEDIYITGMCAPKVHVPILADPKFDFKHP